ncbi:MAG: DUF5716 family protein [Clostridiales bacterium]|nr:DUF5716 family protein [Clostridiales bacterium]
MKLFDVVPGNFFSVLSSGNREIYYDALMILHEMFSDELNIRVDDYIASLISILEDRAFVLEDDDEAQEGGLTASGKARLILDRFRKTGWVDREFIDGSFVEILTPRRHAIPVLKLLRELGDNDPLEYNSLVFAAYSGLKQAMSENEAHLYEALLSAKANTEQLQYALRALYHGIRGFQREAANLREVNLLLSDYFNEYKQMSDRIYHPIKTMDSVHRYMSPIQNLLADILGSEKLMQSMRERAVGIKKYSNEQEANDEIVKAIDYVSDFYHQTVGGLVNEIDRKHSAYTKGSIDKIQYLMTADQSIKGKLIEILTSYADMDDGGRERLADAMEREIKVGRQEFFDERSLYHRSMRSRDDDEKPLAVEQKGDISEWAEGLLLSQIKSGYPLAKIRAFIESLFPEGASEISARDISINSDTEFVMLILAVIRQKERGATYAVDIESGQTCQNGYLIPNMTIRRKGAGKHVE